MPLSYAFQGLAATLTATGPVLAMALRRAR